MPSLLCHEYRSPWKLQHSPDHKEDVRMLESKAIIGDTNMLPAKQKDALSLAGKALDEFDITDSTEIACFIKKEFDKLYGQGWQCIVGTDFGSFETHHMGSTLA